MLVVHFATMDRYDDENLARARKLHRHALVIDTHCDTTMRLGRSGWHIDDRHESGHVDIPRLREGGVDAVFLAVWARGPLEPDKGITAAREQIQRIAALVQRHQDSLTAARSPDDIERAHAAGKIAILTAIEGGYLIGESLDVLREYHQSGAMYMTLTHDFHTTWADSSGVMTDLDPRHGGLTEFGREVVRELNALGMMVDVSHVSDATFWDVIETSCAPVVATHSSCRGVTRHRRNLTDDMMRAIAATGGVVQINFGASFVDADFPSLNPCDVERFFASPGDTHERLTDHVTPLAKLVDHFDHALQTIGPDHVGIGSDFDGVPALPEGLEDCARLPHLTAALLGRGYDEPAITKVLGANVLRVMNTCRDVAAHPRQTGDQRKRQPPPLCND